MPCDYLKASFKYAEKVRKLAKKLSVDVVHVHDWMTFAAGIAASEVLGKPLVTHIHNTVFDRGGGNYNPYEYKLEKLGFEKADKIISVSNYTRNMLIDKYGIKKDKIEVVHNGVEETVREDLPIALKPLKDLGYKVVLYLGRITLQKGIDYLIYAAKKVLEKNPKVIFVIVGSGDMQEQMMSLAASLGILDKVIFTGFLRGEDRTRIFQAADLCVMPSVSEPFGIVPLEAVAFGTPVLVSKQSGVSEVLKHALKVDFWDVDEMTNKILSVCQYPELGFDLSKESAKELPSVNWDNAADKCMGVYRQLVH
jgi:glycosyltransferase involved in cell wall biosynthesis